MIGNSGGGSLFSYYDAEARKTTGSRVTAPPGGGPPDLNKFELPTADGFILLAAHPGQGRVLTVSLDVAVVDENDPYASDSMRERFRRFFRDVDFNVAGHDSFDWATLPS